MKNLLTSAFSISILIVFFLSSCSGNKQNEAETNAYEHNTQIIPAVINQIDQPNDSAEFKNVSKITHQHVNNLIIQYEEVKNTLVQSDYYKTQGKIKGLIDEIVTFNSKKELKEEQDGFYLKVGAKLKNNAERMLKSKDLTEQRTHFSALTSDVLKIVKAFGGNEKEIYYQFCPMAFDNTGGYWLSLDKEIRNPYFGDKMLKCGTVRETIK